MVKMVSCEICGEEYSGFFYCAYAVCDNCRSFDF